MRRSAVKALRPVVAALEASEADDMPSSDSQASMKSGEVRGAHGVAEDGDVQQAGCLADVWVGQGRIAWLDVGAGPFQWGPTVRGRGVKTHHTLPVCRDAKCSLQQDAVASASAVHQAPASNQLTRALLEDELAAMYDETKLLSVCVSMLDHPEREVKREVKRERSRERGQ